MNCSEVETFVSVLYDGEPVPVEVANHVDGCPNCHARLRSYSQIGAELRLMASRQPNLVSPPAHLRAWVLVPRFAVVLVAAALIAASASIVALRAQIQKQPLWFEYLVSVKGAGPAFMHQAAQAGYDHGFVLWAEGKQVFGVHVAIFEVKQGNVQLGIRARRLTTAEAANGYWAKKELGDLQNHAFTYAPGQTLGIPVEGGGTLVLNGLVVDHRPVIAGDLPGEPRPDQLVLCWPLVVSHGAILANFEGGTSVAEGPDSGGRIYIPGTGQIVIALRPFPGAVAGEANWANLNFRWQGEPYTVRTASPLTGDDQPRPVWVALDSKYKPRYGDHLELGTAPLTPAAEQAVR